jgi:cyclophilin family peptidyl-prolyl cis-trans isomerase
MSWGGWSSLLLAALLLIGGGSFAQDDAAPKPKETEPAGEASSKFDELFEQWKKVIQELRKLRTDYTSVKPEDAEAKALEQKWKDLIAQGNALLPQLRTEGVHAYSTSASVDPQLQRFLIKVAQDSLDADDYEVAYEVAKTMLDRSEADKAPAPKELYGIAAVAAFFTNEYDACEKYVDQAKSAGAWKEQDFNKSGIPIESSIKKYKGLWATEQELRDKEAKADDLPRVKLTTTAGDIVLELFENEAPDTVGNFVSLVESDFYNGLKFHRVLPHFMAQGGDPKGTGNGGPGYTIYDEVDKPNYRHHFRGSLSMAKTEFPDTGGSQFFLCFTPRENLDGKHTVFGRVIEGMDVLARIHRIDPDKPAGVEPTVIEKGEVLRKREHKYLPRKVEQ